MNFHGSSQVMGPVNDPRAVWEENHLHPQGRPEGPGTPDAALPGSQEGAMTSGWSCLQIMCGSSLSLLLLPISKLFLCVSGIPCIVRKSSSQCLFHLVLTCYLVSKSCPTLLPWTVASQAPPSVGFPRQKYCSGLPFPSPGDLLDPEIKLPLSF